MTDEEIYRLAKKYSVKSTCGDVDQEVATRINFARAVIAAHDDGLRKQEPVAWGELFKKAEEFVDSKPVYKKFADGTPLLNDIPVWLADFAENYAAPIPPTPSQQEAMDAANRLLNFAPEFEGGDEFSILESFILARPGGEKK
jgi:hypothetical protein